MKKIVYIIAVLLIGIVFNFSTSAHAATDHYWQNQDTSAYTGSTCGHGCTYGYLNSKYATVAVHINSSNNPVIPFGTQIKLDNSLNLRGANSDGTSIYKNSFTVTDTGSGKGRSAYWIDVYYGSNNTGAVEFGEDQKVSYHATY